MLGRRALPAARLGRLGATPAFHHGLLAAQTMAVLQGRIFDASGLVLPGAAITVRDDSTGFVVLRYSDRDGRYYIPAIPAGTYRVTVEASGFRGEIIEHLTVTVGQTLVRDFQLAMGTQSQTVVVQSETPLIDRASSQVGHVVASSMVQELPLNGRHFTDLGLLVPGSVAPSQTGFSSRPIRGVGALAFNTGGNREEAVAFIVNGITTNNLTFGSLIYEPPLTSIQEFRANTSAFGAEFGHVSGAIVNLVTRSGSDDFRGEGYELFRHDTLDARNAFEVGTDRARLERHQFGGFGGGPIWRGRSFFFATYEGVRHRQGVNLNSLVPTDEQRASVTNPIVRELVSFIPRATVLQPDGTARFVGTAPAIVHRDRWTIDVRHRLGERDWAHVFYGSEQTKAVEPGSQGNSIPGFGHVRQPSTSVLTANHTHTFGTALVNEARFGRIRLDGGTFPATALNPADFGIDSGVSRAIGLPQMIVAGDLNFGGPGILPQGRYDTSYVVNDVLTGASGRHSFKLGGEYRHFINKNFAEGTGTFTFPSMDAFLAGRANAFNTTLGERTSIIDQPAVSAFAQDSIAVHRRLTIDVGVRYEWHVTPTERDDRFVVFDATSASLERVGVDLARVYRQNHNLEPRLGFAWTLGARGTTVLRGAFGVAVDQPGTTAVRDTASNPPFGVPLTAAGSIPLSNALAFTHPLGLAPATVDPNFTNASLLSWNLNVQQQVGPHLAFTVGYNGSRGRNLRISRNINQPVAGIRPFPEVSSSSPILPGSGLGIITQVESSGFSSYHAGWFSVTKRLSDGVQFDLSYTCSKSLDTNSLNSSGFAVQDAYDIAGQYGLSDYDARHRFVASASYDLPFNGNELVRGWQLALVVQAQSGNPVNIVTSNSSLTGTPNTVRPDVIGPIRIIGHVDRWFDPSAFAAVDGFGNLGRNVVIGPGFANTDLAISKRTRLKGVQLALRLDVFNLFNHANLGPPGNIVGTPVFGRITRTRLGTGESGSSRQLQISVRLAV